MPLTLKKRSGSPHWYVRGTVNGIEVFETTGTSDKGSAEKYLAEYQSRLVRAKRKSTRLTFSDAVRAYIEFGGDDRYLVKPLYYLGNIELDLISQSIIEEAAQDAFKGYRRKAGGRIYVHSPATIKREFYTPIKAVMNYAAERNMCALIRIKSPRSLRPPPQWAELDYLEKLWAVCDSDLLALTMFLPFTGCRISECLNLEWADVNLDEGLAWVKKTKTDTPRMVHITPETIQALVVIKKDSGYVFRYRTKDSVRGALKNACRRAGIQYLSSHKIGSHTYATLMRRYAGMDARGLIATGRWKSEGAVAHYTHTKISEEARKADILSSRAKIRANGENVL